MQSLSHRTAIPIRHCLGGSHPLLLPPRSVHSPNSHPREAVTPSLPETLGSQYTQKAQGGVGAEGSGSGADLRRTEHKGHTSRLANPYSIILLTLNLWESTVYSETIKDGCF